MHVLKLARTVWDSFRRKRRGWDTRVERCLMLGLVVALVSLAAGSFRQHAFSEGTTGAVDQSNITRWSVALNIGCYSPIGQSFTSSGGQLRGVTLALIVDPRFAIFGPAEITVRIRDGGIFGPVLATSTRTLEQVEDARRFEYFEFPEPVGLSPGGTYTIEAASACPVAILWYASGGFNEPDGYPGGHAYVNGRADGRDFIFQTCIDGPGQRCFQSGRHVWPEVIPPPVKQGVPPCTPPYDPPDYRCWPG